MWGDPIPRNKRRRDTVKVGIWVGTDGQSVIAALNPGNYGGSIGSDLTKSPAPTTPSATDLAVAPYARRGGPEGLAGTNPD